MKQLTQREKWAVSLAGMALVLFLVLQFLVVPLGSNRSKLIRGLAERKKAVSEMRVMQERYRQLNQQSGSIAALLENRESGFSLFSFLEKNADDSKLKEHIAFMKPSESLGSEPFKQSMVEMKMQAVSLKQLVDFLEKTESPEELVGIVKVVIQHNTREATTLDVTLQIASVDQAAAPAPQ